MNEPTPTPNEQTRWTGTVSQWHYAGKWLFVVILAGAIGTSFWVKYPDAENIFWIGRAALAVLALVLIGWIQLDRSRRKYTVTNRRISMDYGIVSKTSNEIRIQDVRSMNLRKHGISGLFGIGTVEFSSAATDDADVIFWNTPGVEKVRDLVRSLQSS